jgi:Na+-transporting NADH:ubiquinone oxidoreductase subunit NqrB
MIRRFLSIVPKKVQLWAWVVAGCAFVTGLVVGYVSADSGAVWRTMLTFGSAALLLGIVFAIWLLCLGFVFADARRRAMRPVPWVLVAALFPHLLGILLYFVLRQPMASTCTHCGKTVPLHQPFCSWCGASLAPAKLSEGPLTANPL